MPKNSRPGTFFGDWDPQWQGSTQTERKLAQNQYDIEEQLENLNEKLDKIHFSNEDSKEYKDTSNINYNVKDDCRYICLDYDLTMKFMNLFNKKVLQEIPKDTHIETPDEYMNNLKESNRRHNNLMTKATNAKQLSLGLLIFTLLIITMICSFTLFNDRMSFFTSCVITLSIIIVVSMIWLFLTNLYIGFRYIQLSKNNNIKQEEEKVISSTFEKLQEFRLSHYNTSIERIIKQLTVPKIQNYYGMYISPNDITGYGTIEDYEEYFRKELEKDSN